MPIQGKERLPMLGHQLWWKRILRKLVDRTPFLSNKGSALLSRWTPTQYKKAPSASFSIVLACCLHWLTLSQAKGSQPSALATYTFLRHWENNLDRERDSKLKERVKPCWICKAPSVTCWGVYSIRPTQSKAPVWKTLPTKYQCLLHSFFGVARVKKP